MQRETIFFFSYGGLSQNISWYFLFADVTEECSIVLETDSDGTNQATLTK